MINDDGVQLPVALWEDRASLTTLVWIVTPSAVVRCVHVTPTTSSRTQLAVSLLPYLTGPLDRGYM